MARYNLLRLTVLVLTLLFVMGGCKQSSVHDTRLMDVYELSDSQPQAAIAKLDSICCSDLSDADQYFYNFLEVKLRDKRYVKPSSDDSIKALLTYYESNGGERIYPEVVYYAGRTYSDLGDYPRALEFYQKALSELPEEGWAMHLRGNILSQYGRLLNRFRLYKEAIPYLEKSLAITRQENDSLNIMYDLQLLGRIKMDADYLEDAKGNFNEALQISEKFGQAAIARNRMYLASVALKEKDLHRARQLINGIPETVSEHTKGQAMALAGQIYHEAGILDSTYYYAKQLIDSPDENYSRNGYYLLMGEDMRGYINSDSLSDIAMAYGHNVHKHFDENERNLVLLQQSTYNYTIAQKDKEEAIKKSETLRYYLFIALVIILILAIGILLYALHRKSHKIRLFQAIGYLSQLLGRNNRDRLVEGTTSTSIKKLETTAQLQDMIESVLTNLQNTSETPTKISVADQIVQSEAYSSLKNLAEEHQCITRTSSLLKDLEQVIHKCHPSFKTNLYTITEGKMTLLEYETALLMKCGFSTTDISVLLCRSKSAITQRRESLAQKIVGFSVDKKTLCHVINVL